PETEEGNQTESEANTDYQGGEENFESDYHEETERQTSPNDETENSQVPELPNEQIEPLEEKTEERPAEEAAEEPSESRSDLSSDQEATNNVQPKKLYHYDYGDIMNGIELTEDTMQNDISTLDQRISRLMSSKILEEKNLTEQEKIEL